MDIEIDNRLLAVGAVVIVIGLLLLLLSPKPGKTELCFNSPEGEEDAKCIEVEVMNNDKTRTLGLSTKVSLEEDKGMLFVFDTEAKYSFWMKRMKFPIDIIWVSKDKRVLEISKNLPICKTKDCPIYQPKNKTLYVVEVNANFTDRYNITNKSVVFFELPN